MRALAAALLALSGCMVDDSGAVCVQPSGPPPASCSEPDSSTELVESLSFGTPSAIPSGESGLRIAMSQNENDVIGIVVADVDLVAGTTSSMVTVAGIPSRPFQPHMAGSGSLAYLTWRDGVGSRGGLLTDGAIDAAIDFPASVARAFFVQGRFLLVDRSSTTQRARWISADGTRGEELDFPGETDPTSTSDKTWLVAVSGERVATVYLREQVLYFEELGRAPVVLATPTDISGFDTIQAQSVVALPSGGFLVSYAYFNETWLGRTYLARIEDEVVFDPRLASNPTPELVASDDKVFALSAWSTQSAKDDVASVVAVQEFDPTGAVLTGPITLVERPRYSTIDVVAMGRRLVALTDGLVTIDVAYAEPSASPPVVVAEGYTVWETGCAATGGSGIGWVVAVLGLCFGRRRRRATG